MLTFQEFLIEKDLSVDDARTILGLPVGFSQDSLKAAYHKAAKQSHPDAGGNDSTMMRVNAAYSRLKSIGPEPVVSPSTTSAEMTAASNDPDEKFRQERARRRAELLAKQRK